MHFPEFVRDNPGLFLIISAGIATYIASKAAVDAMVGGGSATPGRLAIGQWLPILVLGVMAALTGRSQVAVGIVFSTAVACLSLAAGSAVFVSPLYGLPASRRCWAMLVPAGLLAFLAGFRAEISIFDALVLVIEGAFVLLLWTDRVPIPPEFTTAEPIAVRTDPSLRSLQFLLAVALAAVGAWLAMSGVDKVTATTDVGSAGLLTATLLSPLLVLPIIGTGSELAQKNQAGTAVSSHVGVALLNVFALLPLLVLIAYRHEIAWRVMHPSTFNFLDTTSRPIPIPHFNSALIFPLAVWRVDVVMMIALGLLLLPVAVGRWTLNKLHGAAMMFAYILYLILSLAVVRSL